ncbi:MAG: flavin reductase family protein, partial [Trueperaceae bacterium]
MRLVMDDLSSSERYKLLTGTVVPRPIGWISTVDQDGTFNLAPFSYFMVAATNPPTLAFSGGHHDSGPKDSVRNAIRAGQFVANVADRGLLEAMNASSVDAPPHVDEFAHAGLEPVASDRVAAPRVAAAPVAFECELTHQLSIGSNTLVFGRVLVAHLRDGLRGEDGRIDVRALDPVARLAGTQYAALGDIVELARPAWEE